MNCRRPTTDSSDDFRSDDSVDDDFDDAVTSAPETEINSDDTSSEVDQQVAPVDDQRTSYVGERKKKTRTVFSRSQVSVP